MLRKVYVSTSFACYHLGIKPPTLRDWRRRGLIEPAGGTPRNPQWDLAQLARVRHQPRPRRAGRQRLP